MRKAQQIDKENHAERGVCGGASLRHSERLRVLRVQRPVLLANIELPSIGPIPPPVMLRRFHLSKLLLLLKARLLARLLVVAVEPDDHLLLVQYLRRWLHRVLDLAHHVLCVSTSHFTPLHKVFSQLYSHNYILTTVFLNQPPGRRGLGGQLALAQVTF